MQAQVRDLANEIKQVKNALRQEKDKRLAQIEHIISTICDKKDEEEEKQGDKAVAHHQKNQ